MLLWKSNFYAISLLINYPPALQKNALEDAMGFVEFQRMVDNAHIQGA